MQAQVWREAAAKNRRQGRTQRVARVRSDDQIVNLGVRMLSRFLKRSEGAAARDLLRSTGKEIILARRDLPGARYEAFLLTGSGVTSEVRFRMLMTEDKLDKRVSVKESDFEAIMRAAANYSRDRLYPVKIVGYIKQVLNNLASQ